MKATPAGAARADAAAKRRGAKMAPATEEATRPDGAEDESMVVLPIPQPATSSTAPSAPTQEGTSSSSTQPSATPQTSSTSVRLSVGTVLKRAASKEAMTPIASA